MENFTYGINQLNQRIPIEEWVRSISIYPRVFTIALFDCCRIPLKAKDGNDDSSNNEGS
jgi:hypothetical protein